MGWWGYGIRESDDALDVEHQLLTAAGLDPTQWLEGSLMPDVVRTHLERALPALLSERSRLLTEPPDWRSAMEFQVLAALLMQTGCALSETVRQLLRQGCTHCDELMAARELPDGVGAASPSGREGRLFGRRMAIESLAAQLDAYDIYGGHPAREEGGPLMAQVKVDNTGGTTLH